MLLLYYCYFSFRNDSGAKHDLRVRVTPSMCLEWHLYINDNEVGYMLDEKTNILIPEQIEAALSFKNVNRVYADLLEHRKPPTPLNPHPLPPKLYHEWRAELVTTIARATGQSEAVIKINDTEAEKWYRDGFTAYQCFRETYDMENDAGLW